MEMLNAIILEELQSESQKVQLLSIFHSHPSGNYPSATDLNHMRYLDNFGENASKFTSRAFKNLIWLIIDAKNYNINGFIYFENEIHKIDVIIS
jgi:proteasome lid subunit RPN8/RPN11